MNEMLEPESLKIHVHDDVLVREGGELQTFAEFDEGSVAVVGIIEFE